MTRSPKKIGFFLPTLQAGGTERAFVNLAIEFHNAGFTVDFLLKQRKGEYLGEIPPGIQVIDLKASRMFATLPGLTRYIRSSKPQALISGLELPNSMVILSKMLAQGDAKIILTIRSVVSMHRRYFLPTRRLERLVIRILYPLADHTVAVSRSAAQDFSDYSGMPFEKIKVIYNPVLTPKFYQKLKQELDHPWFTPHQPPVILGVGRFSEVKDFKTLIRAFHFVQERFSARLIILGDGPQRSEIEDLISQYGLESCTQLPGFTSNPYPYFKNAAVFVLSSLYDAAPNVLVEAMACGCPVVSTACPGGAAELIANGKYGHLTPVGDDRAMAEAIVNALQGDKRPAPADWLANFHSQTAFEQYLWLVEGRS